MRAMRWMRRWATYREPIPLRMQMVVVLVLTLVMGVIVVCELRREKKVREEQRKALIERAERLR